MQKLGVTFEFEFAGEKPFSLKDFIFAIEKRMIESALDETKGVKTHAAALLGLNRTTMLEKMRRFGLPLNAPYVRD